VKIGRLADIEREKRELETEPEKELEELTAIYEVCGLDQPLALQVAEARMKKYAFRGALAMVLTVRVGRFFFILFQIVEAASSG
jgi:hypothetical protein